MRYFLRNNFRLQWDAEKMLEDVHLKYSKNEQDIKTHDQLKKKLYRDIIQLFDEGDVGEEIELSFSFFYLKIFKAWEKAIEVCKELQIQYEQSFEYDNLSSLLVKSIEILFNIHFSRCFLS